MATKRQRKSESPTAELTVQDAAAIEASQIVLQDVRVVKLLSERFLPPEEASRGTYSLSVKEGSLALPEATASPLLGTLVYSLVLEGYKLSDDELPAKAKRIKSFSISLDLEAKFEIIVGTAAPSEEEVAGLIKDMLLQIHAVGIERLRTQTTDLGYRAVRPDLAPRNTVPVSAKRSQNSSDSAKAAEDA